MLAGVALITAPPAANAQSAPSKRQVIWVPCDSTLLPQAITDANSAGTATVRLASNCTYITAATLTISGQNVTVVGGRSTWIRANPAAPFGPVIQVATGATLRARGFSILGGNNAATAGGINVVGTGILFLSHMTLTGNNGVAGGGINVASTARAIIAYSLIKSNTATSGGGVYNLGSLTVFNSQISGNSVTKAGGGIYNGNVARVIRSTIDKNSATGPAGLGGGIYNDTAGTLSIFFSLIAPNKAILTNPDSGGGVYNAGAAGSVAVTNSVIRKNIPTNCSPLGAVSNCLG
jgi:hypothetical protein